MAMQRLLHAVPVAIEPKARLKFSRATLLPGVFLQKAVGPLARKVADRSKSLPVTSGFVATHLILIEQNAYFEALDERLRLAGTSREKGNYSNVDFDGLIRQVLIAVTLRSRCEWRVGGHHTYDNSDADFPYRTNGYSHRFTEGYSGPQFSDSELRW